MEDPHCGYIQKFFEKKKKKTTLLRTTWGRSLLATTSADEWKMSVTVGGCEFPTLHSLWRMSWAGYWNSPVVSEGGITLGYLTYYSSNPRKQRKDWGMGFNSHNTFGWRDGWMDGRVTWWRDRWMESFISSRRPLLYKIVLHLVVS